MSQPITIDNYDVKVHERYASDQTVLDLTYINESHHIPPHLETAEGESTITAKWEALFETNLHRHPWAFFSPPPQFKKMRNRFFSAHICDAFQWDDSEEEEGDSEEKEQLKEYREKILAKKSKQMPIALLEKDRTALLKLLDSIQNLNGLLRDINSRKLQYQKG